MTNAEAIALTACVLGLFAFTGFALWITNGK